MFAIAHGYAKRNPAADINPSSVLKPKSKVNFARVDPHRRKDALIVILECFFDGGNKSDSLQYDYVTLAAVSGTFQQWKPFKHAWKRNLDKHGAKWLHTTDAAVGNTPFSRDEGWTRQRIDAFVLDCVRIAGKHIARPITSNDPGRIGIYPCAVTVNLKDYIRARKDVPDVPPSVDETLVMQTISKCIEFARDYAGTKYFSLVFDQNEPFRGHIIDRQRNSKFLRLFPKINDIISNTEADMRFFPALQLADLFAYCHSHKRATGEKFRWEEKILSHPVDEGYADYDKLIKPIIPNIEMTRQMRFPRRAATR
jgi:hypothetical protein